MSVRHLVVGVDDSPGTRRAIEWAAGLASQIKARVTCVHAFEPLAHLEEVKPGVDFHSVKERTEGLLRADWAAPLNQAGVEFDVRIEDGLPADVILEVAAEVGVDLIVVGARRLGLIKELALGSTSHKILHHAKVPVVVVPQPDE